MDCDGTEPPDGELATGCLPAAGAPPEGQMSKDRPHSTAIRQTEGLVDWWAVRLGRRHGWLTWYLSLMVPIHEGFVRDAA